MGPRAITEPPAASTQFGLTDAFDIYSFPALFTSDDGGANDYSGQNDLNVFNRADNVTGKLGVAWKWDDINAWTGSGQTGDACALFDTDPSGTPANQGGGSADYALCVRITNPNGDPNTIAQVGQPLSPILYKCSDKKADRCTTTFEILDLGGSFCEVLRSDETFPGQGDDGFDVLAACSIELSAIGNPPKTSLLNVCSFPSGSPNSNPFDCVVTPGSGFIQIKKKTTPQTSGATFSFTLNNAAANDAREFSLTDDQTNQGSPLDEMTAQIPVPKGTYSITEHDLPAGWSLTSASCDSNTGSKSGNALTGIVVGEGQTVVCTFENTQGGSITIVKDAVPNDQQDFAFAGDITSCTSFTLDDDAGATGANDTYSNQKVCPVAPGTYSVDETVPSGWAKTSAICSDGSLISTIAVSAGENVTCTFTNTKNGSIIIVKDAVPDDGQDFAFTGNITDCTSFSLDDDSNGTLSNSQGPCSVAPGTYNIAEGAVSGWVQTDASCSDGSPVTAIVITAGENVTCTFTNTKNGSITIVKDAAPDDAQDFAFTGNITGCTSFSLDDDSDGTLSNTQGPCSVAPGTYNVAEGAVSGWAQATPVCSDGSPASAIVISAGENVTCTFTNTKGGSITIVKDAVPNDAQDFTFTGNITGCTSFSLDDDSNGALSNIQGPCAVVPGTYNVAEGAVTGWIQTSAICSDGSPVSAIVVSAGENVTCTFTNTKNGSITIVKNALPDDAQDFAFTGNITGCTSFSLDDDSNGTLSNTQGPCSVEPGTYNVAEGAVSGWVQTGASCSDGSPVTAIVVSAGENVTCTFTNTKNGSITIVKDAQPNALQDFVFTGNITGCTTFTLDDDSGVTGEDNTNLNQKACTVAPGTFNVDEAVPAGWSKTSATCSDGSPITAIVVSAGESVTCTFVNAVIAPQINVTKSATPGTFSAVAGTLPTGFVAEDTFRVNPTPPAPGSPSFASPTCDDQGPNDINSAQVDLNCFNRADNIANRIFVRWTWDSIDEWGGGGSTGDGCALLDTDNDGNANLAICARIQNDANGNIVQVGGNEAADVYTCNDTKVDRCAKQVTQLLGAAKGATKCTIQSPVADGFPNEGDDGADVQATCEIDRAMLVGGTPIPATTDLLNVCSFPSGEPNSNPFDCVVKIGSGFIQIVKATNLSTSSLFGFTLGSTANSTTTNYVIQGAVASALIPVPPTSGSNRYTLVEAITSNWTLGGATCVDGTASRGTYNAAIRGFNNIVVNSGQTTVCTFTNNGQYTTDVVFKIEVENTGSVGVTLTYLNDSVFGDVASISGCPALGAIQPGPTKYSCTFTRTLTGAPNATHSNTVTARARDIPTNTSQVEDTATAQFSFPPLPPP